MLKYSNMEEFLKGTTETTTTTGSTEVDFDSLVKLYDGTYYNSIPNYAKNKIEDNNK